MLGDCAKIAGTTILDRFLHHAETLTITGRSYRLKDRVAPMPPPEKKQQKQPVTGKSGKTACQTDGHAV